MLKGVFEPGAMYQMFEVPLANFTDQYLDTETVIGNEIKTINEQMANADSYRTMIETAEKYLWKKIMKSRTEPSLHNHIFIFSFCHQR